MDSRRAAAIIFGIAGAAAMAVSPFPDWYRLDTGDSTFSLTGWNAFEMVDLLLVAGALATLFILLRDRSAKAGLALLSLGLALAVIVGVQMTDKPPLLGFPGGFADVSLRAGAWLALAGTLLVALAGAVMPRLPSAQPRPRTK